MSLKLTRNTISGMIGGKAVHCSLRFAQGSGSLAPGEYEIHAPVHDPIHGFTAILTASRPGAAQALPAMGKVDFTPGSPKAMGKVDFTPAAPGAMGKAGVPPQMATGKVVASGKHMDPMAATGKVVAAGKHMDPMAATGKAVAVGKHMDPMAATGKVMAAGKHMDPMAATGKVNVAAQGATAKHVGSAKHAEAPGAAGQVFVISARPMQGRNCLVLTSGFADLMEALQIAGGAKIIIS
jgi:hypothetical protein